MKAQVNLDELFSGVNVEKIQFSMSYNTRFYNEDGSLQRVDDVLNIADTVLSNRIVQYSQEELAGSLLDLLETSSRYDWAANVLLYYIMQKSAITMYPYMPGRITEWREERKEEDILYWKSILSD